METKLECVDLRGGPGHCLVNWPIAKLDVFGVYILHCFQH